MNGWLDLSFFFSLLKVSDIDAITIPASLYPTRLIGERTGYVSSTPWSDFADTNRMLCEHRNPTVRMAKTR